MINDELEHVPFYDLTVFSIYNGFVTNIKRFSYGVVEIWKEKNKWRNRNEMNDCFLFYAVFIAPSYIQNEMRNHFVKYTQKAIISYHIWISRCDWQDVRSDNAGARDLLNPFFFICRAHCVVSISGHVRFHWSCAILGVASFLLYTVQYIFLMIS